MNLVAAWLLLALLAGSAVYCILVLEAVRRYKRVPLPALPDQPEPISILKPLAGAEQDLADNLRSFFAQDYPEFEILCAVRHGGDAACEVFRRVAAEFPAIASRLLITGEPPYPNAKVFSLEKMVAEARYPLLVMSDSDIRVQPGFLRALAAEFQDPSLGLTTCPYRAVAGGSFWSRLEALGMNTEFLAGVLVARMLEGMRFAVGPTTAARKQTLEGIGGMRRLSQYLAEDFVMGKFAAEAGFGVGLSACIVEHRIGSQSFAENMRHRLRWARSTRRSRPAGYVGQIFTNPLPPAVALLVWMPAWWPAAAAVLVLRALAAAATAGWVLGSPLSRGEWCLLAVQDLLSFLFWLAGFQGRHIFWRGVRYYLHNDGRFERIG